MRHRSKLRRRYGRGWAAESAITRPAGGGLYDVVLVDSRGTPLRTLARHVPYGEATRIVRGRHT
jgi:hypothetical protein